MKNAYRVNIFMFVTIGILFYGKLFMSKLRILESMGTNVSTVITEVIFMIYPIIIYIVLTKSDVKSILKIKNINFKNTLRVSFISFLMVPIVLFLNIGSILLTKDYELNTTGFTSFGGVFVKILVLALIPAIIEEFFFRGMVLSEYKNIKPVVAIIVNGVLFGLVQGNVNQLICGILMGMLFSLIVLVTDSVLYSIIMHFIVNCFVVSILTFVKLNGNISLNTWILGLGILLFICVICGIAIFILMKKFIDENNPLEKVYDLIEDEEDVISPSLICILIFSLGYIILPNIILNIFFIVTLVLTYIFSYTLSKMNE